MRRFFDNITWAGIGIIVVTILVSLLFHWYGIIPFRIFLGGVCISIVGLLLSTVCYPRRNTKRRKR
jgi:hypothetical protein